MDVLAIVLAAVALLGLLAGGFGLMQAGKERRRADSLIDQAREAQDRAIRAESMAEAARNSQEQVGTAFKAMSAEALEKASNDLLQRAEQALASRDQIAHAKLDAQLQPIQAKLAEFATHVAAVEEKRTADGAGLREQIAQMLAASTATQDEARKLSSALRRGAGLQGRWGEQMLRNVLELAGLTAGVDFEEQFSASDEEGRKRPDVVVRLPGGGLFVIDSKVSLNDYLASLEATDDAAREAALAAHADSVRRHVQQLSSKAYWARFDKPPHSRSPDVVVLFMPLESAFACLAERAPGLVADAWDKKVAIVTPMALFPLLRAVAYGWRAEDQAANARLIADAGRELHKRVATIAKYAQELGGALDKAVEKYNDFTGSLERNVVTQARRFEALAAQSDKAIADTPEIVARTRGLTKLAPPDEDPVE